MKKKTWYVYTVGWKQFNLGNFYTTRPVGRPRTKWADVVQRDALQLLGIRGCSAVLS